MYLENCLLLFHSCEKTGLNIWAEKILGDRMDKLRRISSIDWGEDRFSTRQITMLCIEHAVNDALVASHIFLGLVKVTFNPLSQDFFFCLLKKKTENSLTPWDPCVEGKPWNHLSHHQLSMNQKVTILVSPWIYQKIWNISRNQLHLIKNELIHSHQKFQRTGAQIKRVWVWRERSRTKDKTQGLKTCSKGRQLFISWFSNLW